MKYEKPEVFVHGNALVEVKGSGSDTKPTVANDGGIPSTGSAYEVDE
jgi:hypothetical protein